MKTLIISLLVTLLLLTASPLAQGQDARLYDKDQIGSQTVQVLCQDERNFLWMGTDNGLCRFDGTQFTTYVHSENDSTSLSDNTVRTLLIDREQRLWVGTENGLQRTCRKKTVSSASDWTNWTSADTSTASSSGGTARSCSTCPAQAFSA